MPAPSSHEEALAEALRDAQPGDIVTIHAVDCRKREHERFRCTCTPIVVTVRGERA